jgi:hypothetical protein
MAIPILSLGTKGDGPTDKRITVVLRKYWDYLREERAFPSEREINPAEIEYIWDNCFIVEAHNNSRKEDYIYKYIGRKIIDAYGEDLTGMAVGKMVAPEAGHLADEYEKVLGIKRPVFDEGTLKAPNNGVIKYRQILLPLGENGIKITAILGGMSYKVFDK